MPYQQQSQTPDRTIPGAMTAFARAVAADIAWCILQITRLLNAPSSPDAQRGIAWYSGHGLPSDDLGIDGDLYLNIDTADVYEKENGTWL